MAAKVRAIEPWIWVDLGDRAETGQDQLPFDVEHGADIQETTRNFFNTPELDYTNADIEQLIAEMDEVGVERAVISIDANSPSDFALSFAKKYPDRFFYMVALKPTGSMREINNLAALTKNEPVVTARITPFVTGKAPNEPAYFPAYVRCIDLDLPLAINTGIPGPMASGRPQDPIYLDDICLQFPELKLCMAHGAHPWWDMAIRLMQKHPNLHLMTTAYLPKYLPPSLIHYMNTRGKTKIICGSDHPYMNFKRTIASAQTDLDLREGVLDNYLYKNAARFFFNEKDD